MQKRPFSMGIEIGLLAMALIGASLLYWAHTQQPYSDPAGTVKLLFKAAASADLAGFQKASTARYYADFVRYFGEPQYSKVDSIYKIAFQLGMPRWQEYHQRAEALADDAYRRLHEKVTTLGREAYNRLSPEERMRLTEDRSKFDTFLFEQGILALPPGERNRIDNVEDFRQGRDRSRFAQREAWNLLSDADRSALGSPAALSAALTPEKLAFIDRVGIPLLNKDQQKKITGIERGELIEQGTFEFRHGEPLAEQVPSIDLPLLMKFEFKYGEPLAKAHLTETKIPQPLGVQPCTFDMEEKRGSLLRGDVAQCVAGVQAGREPRQITITFTLQKVDFRWLVDSVQPDLYKKIPWQVRNE